MFALIPLISLILLRILRCSLVIDSLSQRGIHVSEFCPKMEYCEEGTHVMCMYYDPKHIMGPRCNKPKNVSITPALAEKLLEVTNAIRSKIALGKEKGKDGKLLPRGYGIFRLEWDSELATFAQVLANQCVLRHDICRASKRFSNPGQTAGLVRFSYPDWFPVTNAAKFTKAGLTVSKLDYAITQSLKSWYINKNGVTADMISNFPDWENSPQLTMGKLYLEMISGPATHMGCGISAYWEYAFYDNNAPLNYNSIQVICNYSSRPRKGGSVYEVNPPSDVGYTIRCGCPPGTEEDSDCLCYKSNINPPCSGSGGNCKPAVVLLPIFTVENAPPEKLIARTKSEEMRESEVEIMDYYSPNDTSFRHSARIERQNIHSVLDNMINEDPPRIQPSTTPRKPILRDVKNRFFDKNGYTSKLPCQPKPVHKGHVKRHQSIFSKMPTFALYKKENATFKPDVQPRRDFSKVQNIVKNYMNFRKNRFGLVSKLETTTTKHHDKRLNLNSAEDKVMGYNYYLKNKVNNNSSVQNKMLGNSDIEISGDKSHDSLMNLLDKLEKEVKHIDLDVNKKEILDAKIRKIYGTVVGKPVNLRHKYAEKYDTDITDFDMDFDKYGSDHPQSDTEFEYLDHKVKNLHNKIEDFESLDKNHDRYFDVKHKRPLNIHRNSISINERSGKDNYKTLNKSKSHLNSLYISDDEMKKDAQKPRYSDDDEIKFRHIFSDKESKARGSFSDVGERRKLNDITVKTKSLNHENYNDILSIDRRKYYQEKLDNLEKKLHSRHYKHHKEGAEHQLRPVLPTTREEQPLRPGKTQIDSFYLPDRARFLHGF